LARARAAHRRQHGAAPSGPALRGAAPAAPRLAIALCLPRLRDGGPDRAFLRLLDGFDETTVDPTLLVATGAGQPGIRHVVLGRGRSKRLPVLATVRALRRVRPQVALCTLDMVATAVLARPFLPRGTKVIVRPANHVVENARFLAGRSLVKHRAALALDRACLRWADAVVAQSAPLAALLRDEVGVRGPVRVIPNPIDGDALDALAAEPMVLPEAGAVTVVAAGRLTEQKGFDVLVEAVAAMTATAGLRVWILGSGEGAASLAERIRAAGLGDVIELVGQVANPFPYLAAADLFVLPSRWEGLSNALLEAQALGVPAVATGGAAAGQEVVLDGTTGWVVAEPGARALAAALDRAIDGLGDLDRAAIAERTRDRFDAATIAARYAAFAREVVTGQVSEGVDSVP
jgi:glycosyltransferase involved in cell wall biosynthesis